MSFDADWDIEQYKTKFECEEHWNLKKDFMEAHIGRVPEDKLVCFAQVFANIVLLRCRYPASVMEQVSSLAKEIGHDFKEARAKRLQRTFVKASDAARDKVKGIKRKYSERSTTNDGKEESANCPDQPLQSKHKQKISFPKSETLSHTRVPPTHEFNKLRTGILTKVDLSGIVKLSPNEVTRCNRTPVPFEQLILQPLVYTSFDTFYSELLRCTHNSKTPLIVSTSSSDDKESCSLFLMHCNTISFLASADADKKLEAREKAAEIAIKMVLENCFTIVVLRSSFSDEKIDFESLEEKSLKKKTEQPKPSVGNGSIGDKMLRMMGWSGGGLGKFGQGIKEPVKEYFIVHRSGLGLEGGGRPNFNNFKNKVLTMLKDYQRTKPLSDLVFAKDLAKGEREFIHKSVQRFKRDLKSKSYGVEPNRFLVVSSKFNHQELLQRLQDEGGSTEKYVVYPPATFSLETFKAQFALSEAQKG